MAPTTRSTKHPKWLSAADAFAPEKIRGKTWDRMRKDLNYEALAGPDDLPYEEEIPGVGRTFPRVYGAGVPDAATWARSFGSTAEAVDVLIALAERAQKEEKLGRRGVTDLLIVGISAFDYAGHNWGFSSQEALDIFLRVDAAILRLMKSIETDLGRNVLWALTSDHGTSPVPEAVRKLGIAAERVPLAEIKGRIDEALAKVSRGKGKPPELLHIDPPFVFLTKGESRVSRTALRRAAAEALATHPSFVEALAVEDAHRMTEPYRELFSRSLFSGREPDLIVRQRPFDLIDRAGRATGSSHGSPYTYDSHVPILMAGPGVTHIEDRSPFEIIRLVPTLAALLGMPPPPAALAPPLPVMR